MKNSNTSGLRRHLISKHQAEFKTDNMEPLITTSTVQIVNGNRSKQEYFDDLIVDWISQKYLPYSFFDDDETQKLFLFLNKDLNVPKRTALKLKVTERFRKMQLVVMDILKNNNSKISFTVDGWTSVANKSYYGITAHFIDNDWNIQSLAIDFVPSSGQHSGKDVAMIFAGSLKEYEIGDKLLGVTVDNASANTTFMAELENLLENDGINFNSCEFRK